MTPKNKKQDHIILKNQKVHDLRLTKVNWNQRLSYLHIINKFYMRVFSRNTEMNLEFS